MNGAHHNSSIDMTSGGIWRLLVVFALPLMAENLFQLLYNTADAVIVGRFISDGALAAVGSTTQIVHFFTYIFMGFAAGGTVVAARHFGARNFTELKRDIGSLFALAAVSGLAVAAIGYLIVGPLLILTKTPPDILSDAGLYLRIYIIGIPATSVFSIGSGIMRATGDSRRPVYVLITAAMINIALDLAFIIIFKMGVAGAAFATVISQYASAGAILWLFAKSGEPVHFSVLDTRFYRGNIGAILKISLPQAAERSITTISNVFVQSYVNFFGSVCIAGFTIYSRLDAFVFMLITSVSTAVLTFAGQNSGAGRLDRAQKGLYCGIALSAALTVFFSSLMVIFRYQLAGFFSDDEAIISYSVGFLLKILPFFLLICVYMPCGNFLKGVGDVLPATAFMLSGFVVFKQIYLYVVTRYIANTPVIVMMAFPVGWGVCAALTFSYYLTGRWKKNSA